MSLESAISELESGQSHQEMLTQLRARTVTKDGIAQSGRVLAYLASINKLGAIKALAADETSPLRDAADATLITLQTREGFDFSIPETVGMLQAYTAIGLLAEAQADMIRGLGAEAVAEFESLTLKQVIAIREPVLAVSADSNIVDLVNQKNRVQLLVVTIPTDFPEPVNLQYQVRNKFGSVWSQWEGSSIAGLTNKQLAGVYAARLPGDLIKSDEAQIKIVCPYAVTVTLTVE